MNTQELPKLYREDGTSYRFGRVGLDAIKGICPSARVEHWLGNTLDMVAGETESGLPICISQSDVPSLERALNGVVA